VYFPRLEQARAIAGLLFNRNGEESRLDTQKGVLQADHSCIMEQGGDEMSQFIRVLGDDPKYKGKTTHMYIAA